MNSVSATLPPVVLVEGEGNPNGLSVVRALGRRGIKVYAITPPNSYVRYSRYCTWIPDTITGGETAEERARYLDSVSMYDRMRNWWKEINGEVEMDPGITFAVID